MHQSTEPQPARAQRDPASQNTTSPNNNNTDESPADVSKDPDQNRIVKHIMVIGFHHKHGYQVDYCYPPMTPDGPTFSTATKPIQLPACWKTLPLLCLPDGSHNYDSDTIYFTMPDHDDTCGSDVDHDEKQNKKQHKNEAGSPTVDQPQVAASPSSKSYQGTELGMRTIFGTACYRQIQADKLLNRTDDMTRVSVQKSVCVLSTKPLFGLIRSKLEMITHAYFEELDFSKVKILKLTYDNLNSLLARDSVKDNATFLGLSARHLVASMGYNVLVLFKAMLLEKKILFYKSPVRDLCSTIMSMCSLHAGLLECGGLDYSTCDLQLSPALLEALKLSVPTPVDPNVGSQSPGRSSPPSARVFFSPSKDEVVILSDKTDHQVFEDQKDEANITLYDGQEESSCTQSDGLNSRNVTQSEDFEHIASTSAELSEHHQAAVELAVEADESTASVCEPGSELADGSIVDDPQALKLCRMKPEDCGLPLQIFAKGSFCLPYLSISYLDLISDTRVRSYVIGATNFLFKQRKQMYDIVVDMEENSLTIHDPNLKRNLALTTEDLRFMDYLMRHVKLDQSNEPRDEFDLISHDITKWIGGDEWIRYHFRLYSLYLLKAAITRQSTMQPGVIDSFNCGFVTAWKESTNNYKMWLASNKSALFNQMQLRHPFGTSSSARGLNFSDMKLKLSYAVNSSDKARLINQTLNGIGRWSIWNNIATAAAQTAAAASNAATSVGAVASSTVLAQAQQSGLTGWRHDPTPTDHVTDGKQQSQTDQRRPDP